MSRPKFTPGPWKIKAHGDRFRVIETDQETSVAIVQNMGDSIERISNAELIAAAPDMYDALASAPMITGYATELRFLAAYNDWLNERRAALRKAREGNLA